jgi:hypothetical protein
MSMEIAKAKVDDRIIQTNTIHTAKGTTNSDNTALG